MLGAEPKLSLYSTGQVGSHFAIASRNLYPPGSIQSKLSDFPCNVGSKVSDLQREFSEARLPVDVSLVEEDWTDKGTRACHLTQSETQAKIAWQI
ncbi:phosphoglycerate mutase [Penicillium capsulatum]|uniref:Phosphoglycerate mutase n=1 Tax=Penicillium capsulatum TaxID=69766 RepID=A0A9W9LWY7_9EURO|nr:phosphoglycerate mutase [Penicillium capsulatum]KAJ6122387.1 phosphoglycerate mutase [Penicillium capsulatum]